MIEKRCLRCKKKKPVESFSADSRTKDKHQKWCKDCWIEYHALKGCKDRTKEKKVKNVAKKGPKLKALLDKTDEHKGDMIGAYQEIHGNVSRANASNELNRFLSDISKDEDLVGMCERIVSNKVFHSFVDKYLRLCDESNNPQYMRDAILTMAKISGSLVEKSEVINKTPEQARNDFEAKMSTVLDRMESKETH